MWEIKTKQIDNKIGMRGMDFFLLKLRFFLVSYKLDSTSQNKYVIFPDRTACIINAVNGRRCEWAIVCLLY